MDPVAGTGTFYLDPDDSTLSELFTNISAFSEDLENIEGTWEISNGYRTIDFTTTDACSEDPCGDTIYCLPGDQVISVTAQASTINDAEPPQGESKGATFDGLVDAAANSRATTTEVLGNLVTTSCADGDNRPDADDDDDYDWSFTTTDDQTWFHKLSRPGIQEGEISQTNDLTVLFNTFLKSSTLDSNAVSMWPDPWYEMWFAIRKDNDTDPTATTVRIEHPTLVSNADGGWNYWPVITSDVKSTYQICMYPAIGPNSCTSSRSSSSPYCCGGSPSASECTTDSGDTLPDNAP